MPCLRRTVLLAVALLAVLAASPQSAHAVVAPAGTQAGHPTQAASPKGEKQSSEFCEVAGPVIEGIVPVIGRLVGVEENVCEGAGEAIGDAADDVGNSALDAVATWTIGAATQVTTFIATVIQESTTPQLQSAWFRAQFAPMVDLGAALALLVALIALASAAVRRDPKALAATVAGIARAGIGTGVVVALTVIGLEVADQISATVLSSSPHAFWETVAHAWGAKGWGGLGSSALAALLALIETLAAVVVWLELLVRSAAIYVAVLFFPVILAASIWPALSAWTGRLARLLLLLVILKPVSLIVLSLAGNAAAAGLSFGSGIAGSVGTILTAIVILALAALAPWALMYLLAAEAESSGAAAGARTAAAGAVAGGAGRLGSLGGLSSRGGRRAGSTGGGEMGAGGGGSPSGGSPSPSSSGGGGPRGGGFSPPASPSSFAGAGGGDGPADDAGQGREGGQSTDGSSAANGGGAAGGATAQSEWAPSIAAEAVGAGSVGAAAGMPARPSSAPSGPRERQGATAPQVGEAAPQGASAPAPAGVPSRTPRTDTSSTTAGGATRARGAQTSGDGSAGAPAQERSSNPTADRPPTQASRSHLSVVREEGGGEPAPSDPVRSVPEPPDTAA